VIVIGSHYGQHLKISIEPDDECSGSLNSPAPASPRLPFHYLFILINFLSLSLSPSPARSDKNWLPTHRKRKLGLSAGYVFVPRSRVGFHPNTRGALSLSILPRYFNSFASFTLSRSLTRYRSRRRPARLRLRARSLSSGCSPACTRK
jgi:hypothetical protein